ncbi:hypothetical protein Cgig2_000709 [Carnegiea gigantea]|uniref:Uncharacterized protein n=1 Tax=Carnegiea gigantea TaxID=171969 RepID=A0A9Q1QGN0_9CARY|nr:hypothetical protein Cgig2_000709 [Carnegiea gigantea]
MGLKVEKVIPTVEQEWEEDVNVKKYLRGEGPNLEVLQDKKLKGQLTVKEALNRRSAKAAADVEKWLLPSEPGILETDGIEKTWRIKQVDIVPEVDILSLKKQYDMVLPGPSLSSPLCIHLVSITHSATSALNKRKGMKYAASAYRLRYNEHY